MIENHCIVPACNAYPCWGNGTAHACGAHKHIIGFGAANKPAERAAQHQGEGSLPALHGTPGAPPSVAPSDQGRLL